MAGFADDASSLDVMYADNVDFSGGATPSAKVLLNGQLLIGSTVAPHIKVGSITSTGGTLTITNGSGTINIEASSSGDVQTLTGNTGVATPIGGTINVITANTTVEFVGTSGNLTQDFGTSSILILGSKPPSGTGSFTAGFGVSALAALTTGQENSAFGNLSLSKVTSGATNTAIGSSAGRDMTTGSNNSALGAGALRLLVTGSNNTALGLNAGSSYSTSESSNIAIGNTGTAAESNTIRIGTQGTGSGQQSRCFLAGILNTSSGQVVNVTSPGAYPYTALTTDYIILVDTSAARTINLMATPTTGTTLRIKDNVGTANANNITITPAAGTIDGAASATINIAWGSADIFYNGTSWRIV